MVKWSLGCAISLFQDDEVMQLVEDTCNSCPLEFVVPPYVDAQQIVWITLLLRQGCFMLHLVKGVGTQDETHCTLKLQTRC